MTGPVQCLKGCGKSWPMDPALTVACPECRAGVGARCRRPSGHGVFGKGVHAARDIAADTAGAYGPCPRGVCGLDRLPSEPTEAGEQTIIPGTERNRAVPPGQQLSLFGQ